MAIGFMLDVLEVDKPREGRERKAAHAPCSASRARRREFSSGTHETWWCRVRSLKLGLPKSGERSQAARKNRRCRPSVGRRCWGATGKAESRHQSNRAHIIAAKRRIRLLPTKLNSSHWEIRK